MPAAKAKPKPAQSFQPQFLQWRDGRPRWEPSPKWRKLGWKGHDLRDKVSGAWLGRGEAAAEAEFINTALIAWQAGQPIPEALRKIAPDGVIYAEAMAPASLTAREQSIGFLADAFLADPRPFRDVISAATKRQYASCLRVLLQTVATSMKLTVDELRREPIDLLAKPERGSGIRFFVSDAYDALHARSPTMANACIRVASAWFTWLDRKHSLMARNPCQSIVKAEIAGRVVTLDDAEIAAMVAAFEWLGVPSLGHMTRLGVGMTWPQQDLINLTWDHFDEPSADRMYVTGRRMKTGVPTIARVAPHARAELQAIKQRWIDAGGEGADMPATVFLCELPQRRQHCYVHGDQTCLVCFGRQWNADTLRQYWELAREIASATPGLPRQVDKKTGLSFPSILLKQFRDLRDTGITRLSEFLADEQIATYSMHSLKSGDVGLAVLNTAYKDHLHMKRIDYIGDLVEAYYAEANPQRDREVAAAAARRAKLRVVK